MNLIFLWVSIGFINHFDFLSRSCEEMFGNFLLREIPLIGKKGQTGQTFFGWLHYLGDRFENLQTTVFVKTFELQTSLFNYVKQTKITCDASQISICKTNMVNEVSYSLAKSTVTYDVHRQKDSEFHAVS